MEFTELALPVCRVMPNSVPVYTIGNDCNGVVRFEIVFNGGYGVQDKPLQATFVNRMLREGTKTLSATEISQKLDYYGAWIETYSSQGGNHITLYSLSKHFAPLLQLLENVVKEPAFPQDNLDTVRRNGKAHYEVNSQKVDVVSQRYFECALWGEEHPLGHVVAASDYDAITRDDLWNYYNKVYNSRNCTIFLSGAVDEEMLDVVSVYFGMGEWGGGDIIDEVFVNAPLQERGRHNVFVDNTMQSAIKMGFFSLDSSSPDFHKLRFLTVLLGGYFGSRLMTNIREENGYTYHISAEMDAYGKRNAFMISSEVANEYVEPCIAEIYKELSRLHDEPIPPTEVEHVRNYILGEMCRECEGLTARSEVFINAWLSGGDFDSVNEYLRTVQSVTSEELTAVARKYISKENMIEVVVGSRLLSPGL